MDISVNRKKMLLVVAALWLLCMIALGITDSYIRHPLTPFGILSFEFISSLSQAKLVFEAWGDMGKTAAAFSLGLDYLYIVLYVILGYLCLIITSEKLAAGNLLFSGVLRFLAKMFPLTGGLDAIENYGLIRLLLGTDSDFWSQLAYWSAAAKFTVLAVCASALLLGLCYLAGQRLRAHGYFSS